VHQNSCIIYDIFNVYVAIFYKEKEDCWCSLPSLKDFEVTKNDIVVGDFNVVLNIKEKRGGSIVRDPYKKNMEDLMMDWDLVDVKPMKGKYTWLNRRIGPNHITARLDYFLIQSDLLLRNYIITSMIIPSIVSDHKLISLLFHHSQDFGPLPFRLCPLWLQNSRVMEIIS
jgi:exonuclease III